MSDGEEYHDPRWISSGFSEFVNDRSWAEVVEQLPVGVVGLDEDGRILRANACMAFLLGRVGRALVGLEFGSLLLASDRPAWLRDRSEVIRHGRPVFERERRILRPDGVMIWLGLSIGPCAGDGIESSGVRMVMAASDVSGRRCLQDAFTRGNDELRELVETRSSELRAAHLRLRLADRMAALGTLGAGLGHDMNNVLLPVRAHVNALARTSDDPIFVEHVTAIRQSLAYLQQLADGLHFLALDPEREDSETETDLLQWWTEVRAIMSKALPRGVDFECDLPAELPPVGVSPHRLTQAILNLLVNAGEAIVPREGPKEQHKHQPRDEQAGHSPVPVVPPEGSPHRRRGAVRLSARLIATPFAGAGDGDGAEQPFRPFICISVEDDGCGMDAEIARRVGTLYFTTKTRGMGTGLGLALVRMVTDRAGGSFEVESQPGHGTTMRMFLPVREGADDGNVGDVGDDARDLTNRVPGFTQSMHADERSEGDEA